MRVTRANFGDSPSISPANDGTAVFWFDNKRWFIEDGLREATHADYEYSKAKAPPGPFVRRDFGACDRLSWPAGACPIPHIDQPTFWAERFAIWSEQRHVLTIVDATRATVVRFESDVVDPGRYREMFVHGGKLWVTNPTTVVWFDIADIEGLFERAAGEVQLDVRELYPRRRRERVVEVRIDEVGTEWIRCNALGVTRKLSFPAGPGFAPRQLVTLRDELIANVFLEIIEPGQEARQLYRRVVDERTALAELTVAPSVDPAGELAPPAETTRSRQADLDRLFAARADDPDDDATRFVIVDLLEASGETYAPRLQALLAAEGTPVQRREALGTLASYFDGVEYRGGLPWEATLATSAPLDPEIGELVCADQRLGLFHTIRLADGNYNIYAKLVASPRAVGLRHVDGSRASILAALIAGNRRDLARLSGVKFATREVNEALADSTFDRLREIETETAMAVVAKLLDFVIRDEAKFFSRAPRHLILRERAGGDVVLVPEVLNVWDRLPLDKVTVGGITLQRDGVAVIEEKTPDYVLNLVRAKFEIERTG